MGADSQPYPPTNIVRGALLAAPSPIKWQEPTVDGQFAKWVTAPNVKAQTFQRRRRVDVVVSV